MPCPKGRNWRASSSSTPLQTKLQVAPGVSPPTFTSIPKKGIPSETARLSLVRGWSLYEFRKVASTNFVAANLPVWSAVRADRQTDGRGRFQRTWISDEGGLWLSAVVPVQPENTNAPALPLLAGLAVAESLRTLGVSGLRLRWPNDLMVKNRKLAGLLIDQFAPGIAVVGVGINISNSPEKSGAITRNQVARLSDLLNSCPTLEELTALILGRLRDTLDEASCPEAKGILPRLNLLWGRPRRVELDLDGRMQRGVFIGVEPDGRLILRDKRGECQTWHAWQVRHLTELSG